MPFRAIFDGHPLSARDFDATLWASLCAGVSDSPEKLQMLCCQATAIPCVSPRGRYFFRHRSQPSSCDWKPESDEHLDLKAHVADAVSSAGWTAEIEHVTPQWKADVLATRGKARIAFEVQLSTQGQAETEMRERRYWASNVFPWWIVNKRNDGDGFGSENRIPLIGDTPDERIKAVGSDIVSFLKRVESHVAIARALKSALVRRNLKPHLATIGGIPSVFRVRIERSIQPIVIGELGLGALPDIAAVKEDGKTAPWGAIAQFVRTTNQVRGFGATAFFLRRSDLDLEIDEIVEKLTTDRLKWVGRESKDAVEAAYVWYDDSCSKCSKEIVRVPFLIHAHRKVWPMRRASVAASHTLSTESYDRTVARLEKRLGKIVGKIVQHSRSFGQEPEPDEPLTQVCPHCNALLSDSLVTAAEAVLWPFPEIDFNVNVPAAAQGWREPKSLPILSLPDQSVWVNALSKARAKRAQEQAEKERKRLEQEETNRLALEKWREERDRQNAEAAAAEERKANELAERRRLAEAAHQAQLADARAIRLAKAQEDLRGLALRKCQDQRKVELWLKNYDPKLGGRPIEICGDAFEACRKRLEAIRL